MREGHAEILIVDNDDRIVELVAWFLKKRGFEVRTASSFVEARERIAERRPDLMLSDIDLGAESAIDELPRLDAGGNLPPTLVVSGYLDPGIEQELAALAPVLDTLAKPFDFAVLEDRVQSCLQQVASAVEDGEATVPTPPPATPSEGPSEAPAAEVSDDEGWVEITPADRQQV